MNPLRMMKGSPRPIYNSIVNNLTHALNPTRLVVVDTSQTHAEHAEMRNSGFTETHFEINVVSASFNGLNRVQRHQLVYKQIQDEFNRGLHAVNIKAITPDESTE